MTNGIWEVFKDNEIVERVSKIRKLERMFEDEPSPNLAKEIVDNLKKLLKSK